MPFLRLLREMAFILLLTEYCDCNRKLVLFFQFVFVFFQNKFNNLVRYDNQHRPGQHFYYCTCIHFLSTLNIKLLVNMRFRFHLFGRNFLFIHGPPEINNVGQDKWNKQRNITHSHQCKFARRCILYGQRRL